MPAPPTEIRLAPPNGGFPKRVKTPTIIQIEAVECGAVVLAIILRHFGKYVSIEEARIACDVSRSGVNALKLLKAARAFGLEATGWKKEMDGLLELPLPFVVFWKFSHFVVVEGFGAGKVFLNDPASGPRTVTLEEFDAAFTGVALTFLPGAGFKPSGKPPILLASLWERLPGRAASSLAFLVMCGLSLAFFGLVSPTFQHVFVDDCLVLHLDCWVKPLLWIMLGSGLLVLFIQWLQAFGLVRLSLQLSVNMEGRFLWHLLHLPLSFYSQRFAGELVQRTTINDQVAMLLSGRLAHTAISLLTILPYGLLLFSYNWVMAAVGLTIATLNLVAMRFISRVRTDANSKLLQDQGVLMGTAVAGFRNIESIKATAGEDDFFSRLAGCQAKVISGQQRLGAWSQVLSQGPAFLNHLNTMSMLVIGGFAIMNGQLTLGYLIAFQGLMGAFTAPFADLAGLGGKLQLAKGEITRLDDVLKVTIDPLVQHTPDNEFVQGDGIPSDPSPDRLRGHIELRDVTFGYSNSAPPLLQGLNLVLEPGGRIALVGASGCGKTTIVMLIAGLLEPWSGEVLFDGKPRSAWPRKRLAQSLGHVSQTIQFFEGTILENLTLFDPSISMESVVRASRDACIDEVIGPRPGGYLAPISEGAGNFSGGQSQRLEIARALATDPVMILLDEATSALDPMTEQAVDANIRRRGISTIISAHRLSTVRDAGEIIVLDRGKIVERGKHADLMSHQGLYSQLVSA